jgi:glycosyltransferase involved in cell wall biosynthesis
MLNTFASIMSHNVEPLGRLMEEHPNHASPYYAAPRILHVIIGQEHGGVETFFVKLTKALERRGVPQRVIAQKGRPWAEAARSSCVCVDEVAFGGWREIIARPRIRSVIRNFQPDVVLAWMGRAARRIPRGEYVRVIRLPGFIGTHKVSNIEHAVVTTPIVANFIASTGYPRERIHIIANFGDLPKGDPFPRAMHATPEGVPLILSLGRFVEKKGFDVLLRAMAALPEAYLWLAGSGELEHDLKQQSQSLGISDRVRFLGWITNQERLFATADLCVFPSRIEPFGNVVVEAWQAGCPIIATRSEGPGLIITDGEDGLLVPIDNAAAIASAVRRLLSDPTLRHHLAENGRRTHEEHFSQEAICRQYVDLFRKLAAARRC